MPLTILLADDSMTAQKMGKEILTAAGYVVTAVSNGAAAAKKLVDKPDLIILDVFMPGYTGLEICEKVRASADIAKTPVLLTVGKMEHFDPQETARVKADGLIIKPFEASDLLAAVKKLEGKLAPPEEPAYEKTMILNRSQIQEFKDQSYSDWKTDAEDHIDPSEIPAPPPMQMSQEMGSAPAFADMDMMSSHPTSPASMDETVNFPPPAMTTSGGAATAPAFDETVNYPPAIPSAASLATPSASSSATSMDETVTYSKPVEFEGFSSAAPAVEAAPVVEYRSAPTRDPGLEIADSETSIPSQDPALVTDNTTMATEFPTKFGVAEAEVEIVPEAELVQEAGAAAPTVSADDEFERRVAAAMSGYGEEAVTGAVEVQAETSAIEIEEAPAACETQMLEAVVDEAPMIEATAVEAMVEEAPVVDATVVEEIEPEVAVSQMPPDGMQDASLVEQMQEAFADLPVEAAPPVEEAPSSMMSAALAAVPEVSTPAPVASNTVPDMELANALAAAVGGEMPQANTSSPVSALDHKALSQVLHRVMERMMPSIMTEVEKELGEKK